MVIAAGELRGSCSGKAVSGNQGTWAQSASICFLAYEMATTLVPAQVQAP